VGQRDVRASRPDIRRHEHQGRVATLGSGVTLKGEVVLRKGEGRPLLSSSLWGEVRAKELRVGVRGDAGDRSRYPSPNLSPKGERNMNHDVARVR